MNDGIDKTKKKFDPEPWIDRRRLELAMKSGETCPRTGGRSGK